MQLALKAPVLRIASVNQESPSNFLDRRLSVPLTPSALLFVIIQKWGGCGHLARKTE